MRQSSLSLICFLLFFTCQSSDAYALKLSPFANTDTIKTLPISGSPFCPGSKVTVPFETNVAFAGGNFFTVQLSNNRGSFSSPTALGTMPGTGSGAIEVTLPTTIAAGTGYRFRVVASTPTTNMVIQDNGTNVTIGSPLAKPTITTAPVCAGGTLTLTASSISGATYTWTGPNNFTATGRVASVPRAEVSASGTYTVTVSLNGCSNTASIDAVIQPALANAGPDVATCPGQPVQLTATGGVRYSWSPSATLSDATIANPVATPTASTTYTVTVTGENGCVRTDQVVVTVNPLPVVTIAPAAPAICVGSSVQLQASGAATYSWSPAVGLSDPTSASPVATPLVTTTYTVTGTSASGCVNTKTVTVTVKPLPVANAGFDRTICSGQALTLGTAASSNGTYLWEPATGLSSASAKTPTLNLQNTSNRPITTVYKLTVTSNGCSTTDEVAITVNPAIPASAGPDVSICTGGSAQLQASGGTTYRWSPTTNLSDPNIANPVAFPTATTRYIVTVTNAEGCSRNDTVMVNVNPAPALAVTPAAPSICVGSSLQLQATGATSYSWSPAAGLSDPTSASPIASPTTTTTYTVTGTSAGGCVSTRTVTVRVNPVPVANAGPDKVVCSRQGTVLGAAAVTGYTYSWSPAVGLSKANVANPTLTYPGTNDTPITVEYTLTVTANGCSSTDVVRVTVNPAAYAGPDVTICQNSSTQLQASGGLTYSWSPAAGLSDPTVANPIASPSATTTYTVTVTNPAGTCVKTDQVKVTVNPLPTVTASASLATVCAGGTVNLSATGGTSYQWSPSTGLDNPRSASPVATVTETTTYTVTATDAKGCSNTAQVTITANPLPTATIQASGPTSLCTGGSVTLTASGGTDYLWSNGATTPSITVSEAGAYSVRITNANGCQATSAPANVTVNPLPTATIQASGSTTLCPGGNVTLTASGGTEYLWSNGATTASITVSEAGAYSVRVTNASGCQATSAPTQVTIGTPPTVTLAPFASICKDRSGFELTGGLPAGGTYSGPGVTDNKFFAATAGQGTHTITYTYTDERGCTNSATQTLTVGNCLSAADELQAASLAIYPNPVQEKLNFSVTLTKKEVITLSLTDLKGNVVLTTTISAPAGDLKKEIPVQHLPQGMYLLQYRTAGAVTTRKVFIAR
ncbi:T9SS C-terminal target domain-containing protein [Rufibacter immobilis]|uniref:T9SS C-terminal target domain-containing protein n=1 Tax=Rufibacter immobilis TaxID=1348778 RepID=A0A3M9N3T9_9BACT|nr:T9SS type A sorting domain-containing protein [Rufibacter immobilis]RNI32471.1 T9SS C-terminal target domain-containing protein [Rufibacter immobilis]